MLPGVDAIHEIRKAQQLNRRSASAHNTVHDRLLQKGAFGDFNRLHGGTVNTAAHGSTAPVYSGYGVDGRRSRDGSNFEVTSRDPGQGRGSRFEWDERFDPELSAERVRDAEGAMDGARSTEDGANDGSDHWASGKVTAVDTGWMLDTALRLIQMVRAKRYAEGKV